MDVPGSPSASPRYRTLFIDHKVSRPTAEFQRTVEDEWSATLALHCDLHLINEDFDYGELCDRINPDFVVLRNPGGYRATPVTIRNANARLDIPKIGFYVEDPHDTSRVTFFRLLDELQINRFFVIGSAAFRQSPELASRAFTMSLFIDDSIFKEYDLEKLIPVSVFGGLAVPSFYSWRAETCRYISDYLPTLIYTHPGYSNPIPRHVFAVMGADYAKFLNRSRFSVADATREAYVVRKHLEIPAAGSILVAPEFAELGCYGFRDMENCVLGSGPALYAKLTQVASDPGLYERIRKNGHELVHTRHTRSFWRWIIDWFECQRSLRPGEIVQQDGVLGPFRAVPGDANTSSVVILPQRDSDFSASMRKALDWIIAGWNLNEAEVILRGVASWLPHLQEPYVPLGLIALLRGQPLQAKDLLQIPYTTRHRREGMTSYDPEEIAWLWLTGVLLGDRGLMDFAATQSCGVNHLSLRRMAVINAMSTQPGFVPDMDTIRAATHGDRLSIHWTGQLEWPVWLGLVKRMLAANKK